MNIQVKANDVKQALFYPIFLFYFFSSSKGSLTLFSTLLSLESIFTINLLCIFFVQICLLYTAVSSLSPIFYLYLCPPSMFSYSFSTQLSVASTFSCSSVSLYFCFPVSSFSHYFYLSVSSLSPFYIWPLCLFLSPLYIFWLFIISSFLSCCPSFSP